MTVITSDVPNESAKAPGTTTWWSDRYRSRRLSLYSGVTIGTQGITVTICRANQRLQFGQCHRIFGSAITPFRRQDIVEIALPTNRLPFCSSDIWILDFIPISQGAIIRIWPTLDWEEKRVSGLYPVDPPRMVRCNSAPRVQGVKMSESRFVADNGQLDNTVRWAERGFRRGTRAPS